MLTNRRDSNASLEEANQQVDRLIGIASINDYVESLNQPHTDYYLVRLDGSIEFFKS